MWLWNKLKTREWQTYLPIVHSLSVLGKGLHDNRNVFTPHIYCFEHWTEWKVFSQAFHGAGHKCISRECFNWMRISQHLHTSRYRQIYQTGGPGHLLRYIHTMRSTLAPGPCGTCDLCRPVCVNILILVPGICFCASQIFAFPVITHFISGLKILQKRKELKLALAKKGVGLLNPISNPAFHP